MLRCHRMGADRLGVGVGVLIVAIVAACSSASSEPTTTSSEVKGEAPRVPNPPPRYAHSSDDPAPGAAAAATDPDAGKIYTCGGRTPFTCPLEDGTFVCSETPCLPDCSRIGCVAGEVCRDCSGSFRCVDPKTGC